ncbi:MAG: polyprenyl synthetase family protein [Planctomycetes bacterium]|nr:polyprenyl synthetase family protein [Planctomycetota bacterium]
MGGGVKAHKTGAVQNGAAAYLEKARTFVDQCLEQSLPPETAAPQTLHKAIRYSIFAGGKRLRPALAFAGAEAVGGSWDDAAPVACAVEMIHTYSLIHDDLPAMDDDDLRRGRPTCHKVFGDAIAILAGDGLLTYAFECLASCPRGSAIPAIIKAVAAGSGTQGMVGGQVLDLEGEGKPPTLPGVEAIHRWKTAALITASCEAGALAGGASLKESEIIRNYGQKIGLAFQIVDDILDLTASPETLGKTPGKDVRAQKATYPAVMGLERAKLEAQQLMDAARAELQALGARAQNLEDLARFVVERKN